MRKKEGQIRNEKETSKKISKEYVLRLFITGATPNSVKAVINAKQICEDHLSGNYLLEIVDVYQQADIAEQEQLIALPMLIKKSRLNSVWQFLNWQKSFCGHMEGLL